MKSCGRKSLAAALIAMMSVGSHPAKVCAGEFDFGEPNREPIQKTGQRVETCEEADRLGVAVSRRSHSSLAWGAGAFLGGVVFLPGMILCGVARYRALRAPLTFGQSDEATDAWVQDGVQTDGFNEGLRDCFERGFEVRSKKSDYTAAGVGFAVGCVVGLTALVYYALHDLRLSVQLPQM